MNSVLGIGLSSVIRKWIIVSHRDIADEHIDSLLGCTRAGSGEAIWLLGMSIEGD